MAADLDARWLRYKLVGPVGSELDISLISAATGRAYKVHLQRHFCEPASSASDSLGALTHLNAHLTSAHASTTSASVSAALFSGAMGPAVSPTRSR